MKNPLQRLRRGREEDDIDAGPVSAGATFAICLVISLVLRPFRETVLGSDLALILMGITVVVMSLLGTFFWGLYSGAIAALFFDFFFTRPYDKLEIFATDDIIRVVALGVLGAVSGFVASRRRRRRRPRDEGPPASR